MKEKYSSHKIEGQEEKFLVYFRLAIPRLLAYVEEHSITHILLLEKTARLFKAPLVRLFSELGIHIRVGSYAPDYFDTREGFFLGKNQQRKLDFLGTPKEANSLILILDDFSATGTTLNKAYKGVIDLGFPETRVFAKSLSGWQDDFVDPEESGILNEFLREEGGAYERSSIFLKDNPLFGIRHARINPQHQIPYKEIIRSLTRIILDSTK